jgi:hypothetical protein
VVRWVHGELFWFVITVAIKHTLDHTGGYTDAQLHDWCQLVNGGLYLLAAWLKCDSLDDLLCHVIQHQLYQDARSGFTDDDIPLRSLHLFQLLGNT